MLATLALLKTFITLLQLALFFSRYIYLMRHGKIHKISRVRIREFVFSAHSSTKYKKKLGFFLFTHS